MSAQSDRWTDAFLDDMRQQGDPLADQAIQALHDETPQRQAIVDVIESLVRNDAPTPENLPPALHAYLAATASVPPPVLPNVNLGEQVFAAHGPEILCLLGCYSLPAAYAARKGVQVLHRTGQLTRRANHRLMLTSQMVLDVMSPGGMAAGGRGIRSAQKVRLMHAAVRHLLLFHSNNTWDTKELGVPINQEDLAGTLMTFSFHIMHGLDTLGLSLTGEEKEAYLQSWQAVAHLMGLRPEMIPGTVADAERLTGIIERRQIAPSPEGRELLQALLEVMDAASPRFAHGVPPAIMRRLLPPGVADFLGVPKSSSHQWLLSVMICVARIVDRYTHRSNQRLKVFRFLTIHFIQWMITRDLGRPARFQIPLKFGKDWSLGPAPEGPGVPLAPPRA